MRTGFRVRFAQRMYPQGQLLAAHFAIKRLSNTTMWSYVQPMKSRSIIADKISNFLVYGLIRLFLMLPYKSRVRAFGAFTAYVIAPLAGYTRRARVNINRVWPNLSNAKKRKIARACCDNLGRTLIENYSSGQLGDIAKNCTISGPSIDAIKLAKTEGRPVIFVSGHFGNFEVPRHALTAVGFKIGGIYRRMANPFFNDHYEQTMMGISGPVFAQDRKGVLGFARHIKAGGMGTILFDVRMNRFEDLSFMGHPAPTSSAAAEFAKRFDALMIPYFGKRLPDGINFEVVMGTPIPHGSEQEMMQNATDQLAALVDDCPEQYFWVHRRWRKESRVKSP